MCEDRAESTVATQRTTFSQGTENPKNCPDCGKFLRKVIFRRNRWDKTAEYWCESCGFREHVSSEEDR